jgi:ATP-dependent Lon protease
MTTLRDGARVPSSPFPVLPLRNGVLFPGAVIALPVGRERSVALARTLVKGDLIGVLTQKDRNVAEPADGDLHRVGTFARVVDSTRMPSGDYRLVIEGVGRLRLGAIVRRDPFWLAEGEVAEELDNETEEARLFARALLDQVKELARGAENNLGGVDAGEDPGLFADRVAAVLGLPSEKEMRVLEAVDVVERLRVVAGFVVEQKALSEVKRKIEQDVRREIGKEQREVLLREQLKAIKKELGDERGEGDSDKLREKLEKADLPEEVRAVAEHELKRLEALSPQQAEYNVIRSYLDWIAELPWNVRASATDDIDAVSKKLDEDHYGLSDVKRRILEHMAVLELKGEARGSILCLAGPPGVGKTSIGQSIADATGRPFVRIALGGVRDEAEIRGHRRTYVAALPGRIIHALKKAKVKNPVVLLDEIDKLGVGWAGNPEAALLEVLDPEQNKTFQDHYMELPFDLSEVLFICTANDLGNLSAPLRDRLEIIEVQGYTPNEKEHIARRHLIPKQLGLHAIPEGTLTITDDALRAIVRDYTREAGVRQLEREIKKLCRALSLEVARAKDEKPVLRVDESDLGKYLGKVRFFAEVAERTQAPGVATGMAWTPVGGDILFIETSRMPGRGRVEITGQLGDVMRESAKAALSYVKSHAEELGVDVTRLEEEDLHIHVPAGAVPKDGPSAGVTMFTALMSLLSGRKVRSDTAMTGECTLRGRVLPVGGIKAKVMAAHRAGIARVILPQKNQRDLDEIPEEVRNAVEFFFADDMSQVSAAAFEDKEQPEEVTVPLGREADATAGEMSAVH